MTKLKFLFGGAALMLIWSCQNTNKQASTGSAEKGEASDQTPLKLGAKMSSGDDTKAAPRDKTDLRPALGDGMAGRASDAQKAKVDKATKAANGNAD